MLEETSLEPAYHPPSYSPGSILRTAWYDEVYPPGSYDNEVNNGWTPPGIVCYRNRKDAENRYDDAENNIDKSLTIPWATKFLLYVDCYPDKVSGVYWCRVVWNERLICICSDWLVLMKDAQNL